MCCPFVFTIRRCGKRPKEPLCFNGAFGIGAGAQIIDCALLCHTLCAHHEIKHLDESCLSFRQKVIGSFRQIPPFRSLCKTLTGSRSSLPHRLFGVEGSHGRRLVAT
jgi:hypothetical protein